MTEQAPTTWVLVVMPDGKSLLTTDRLLDYETAQRAVEVFKEWRDGPEATMILMDCTVVRVHEITLDEEAFGLVE